MWNDILNKEKNLNKTLEFLKRLKRNIRLGNKMILIIDLIVNIIMDYCISSNKRRSSNKRHPLISAAPLGIHIEITATL